MGEVITFRPRQPKPAAPPPQLDGGLTNDELIRIEELLRRPMMLDGASRVRAAKRLPSVFTNAGPADEPILPCPPTDVSWLDDLP